tara:strand:- start:1442 stop:2713 length:1272 start_codon:yes stop_codon:yes gene_type:complete
MIKLRPYQKQIVTQGSDLVTRYGFCYLAMEVRTGKTLTSLSICQRLKATNVLFVTKKKAISSIEDDMQKLQGNFKLLVINYESLHKVSHETIYDFLIIDEAHTIGAFPKQNKRSKQIKRLIDIHHPRVLLLSGTPTPESYSQMYHQVCGIYNNPFEYCKNFYQFARNYVDVKKKIINGIPHNDWSHGREDILKAMKKYTISFTQNQAGFKVQTNEQILFVDICGGVTDLMKRLSKDRVIKGDSEVILADTPVKLMIKSHQMSSGTIKFESGNSMVLCHKKATYIMKKFAGKKIAIFYKFKAELQALKDEFGNSLCETLEEFNTTNKSIALQIVSGREGISLRKAEALVYYNIDFSATSYWQSRDRMTTKDRLYNKIYWIFSKTGIEKQIYKAVVKKKDYTLSHFKKDLVTLNDDGTADTSQIN